MPSITKSTCVSVYFSLIGILFTCSVWSQTLQGPFQVSNGNGPVLRSGVNGGSCYKKPLDLDAIWKESLDMAQQAINALNRYGTDRVVRATAETYFGIRPDETTNPAKVLAADQFLYDEVLKTYREIIVFSQSTAQNNQPSFFCDDSWLFKTSTAYQVGTGTNLGISISTQTGGRVTESLWSPLFKAYVKGVGCTDGSTFAYTTRDPMRTITLCPFLWSGTTATYASNSAYRTSPDTVPERALQRFRTFPTIVVHELAHLLFPDVIIDQVVNGQRAYGVRNCMDLAQTPFTGPLKAIRNAETYQWFALAMYLPKWDWSRAVGGLAPLPNPLHPKSRKARWLDAGNGFLRRTFFHRSKVEEDQMDDDPDDLHLHQMATLNVSHVYKPDSPLDI